MYINIVWSFNLGPPPTVSELKKILQEALKQFKEEKLKW